MNILTLLFSKRDFSSYILFFYFLFWKPHETERGFSFFMCLIVIVNYGLEGKLLFVYACALIFCHNKGLSGNSSWRLGVCLANTITRKRDEGWW